MNIFICTCILFHLAMHQYLSNADRLGLFPEHHGFIAFTMISNIFYLGNFIYMFGALWGILIFLSSFVVSLPILCLGWIFQLLIMKTVNSISGIRFLLALYSIGTWGLLILLILNCFVSSYATLKEPLLHNLIPISIICGIGFVLRIIIVKASQMRGN